MLVKHIKRLIAFISPVLVVLFIAAVLCKAAIDVRAGHRLARKLDHERESAGLILKDRLALVDGGNDIDEDSAYAYLYVDDVDKDNDKVTLGADGNVAQFPDIPV